MNRDEEVGGSIVAAKFVPSVKFRRHAFAEKDDAFLIPFADDSEFVFLEVDVAHAQVDNLSPSEAATDRNRKDGRVTDADHSILFAVGNDGGNIIHGRDCAAGLTDATDVPDIADRFESVFGKESVQIGFST